MGRRGPKPQPKHVAKLKGSWRARRRAEVSADPSRPVCPEWLSAEACAEWIRQATILEPRGLFTAAFATALAMYCEAWAEYVETVQELAKLTTKTTITEKGNLLQHPLVGIRNKAFDRVNRLGQQFGFSPTAAVSVPNVAKAKTTIPTRQR